MQRLTGPAVLCAALMGLFAAPAHAAFEVTVVRRHARVDGGGGARRRHDRGRPSRPTARGTRRSAPRSLVFHLPPGLAGDPFATPQLHRGGVPRGPLPGGDADRQRRPRARTPSCSGCPSPRTSPATSTTSSPSGARAGAARRGPAAARRAAREVHRRDDRGARASDGGLDATVRDLPTELNGLRSTRRSSCVHARRAARRAGSRSCATRRRARAATSTVDATPVRRAGRAGLEDVELHAPRLRRAAVRARTSPARSAPGGQDRRAVATPP